MVSNTGFMGVQLGSLSLPVRSHKIGLGPFLVGNTFRFSTNWMPTQMQIPRHRAVPASGKEEALAARRRRKGQLGQ